MRIQTHLFSSFVEIIIQFIQMLLTTARRRSKAPNSQTLLMSVPPVTVQTNVAMSIAWLMRHQDTWASARLQIIFGKIRPKLSVTPSAWSTEEALISISVG